MKRNINGGKVTSFTLKTQFVPRRRHSPSLL